MIKNILIDVDGTLMDTQEIFYHSLRTALSKYKLSRNLDVSLFGMSVDKVLEILDVASIDGLKDYWEELFEKECSAGDFYPGIEYAMRILHEKGLKFYIITSRSHRTVDSICNHSSLGPFIEGCIAAEDTKLHKPSPDPLLLALSLLHSLPEEAIYIGDTYQDYEAATSADIKFAFAGWNQNAINFNYEIVFSKPSDIIEMIEDDPDD